MNPTISTLSLVAFLFAAAPMHPTAPAQDPTVQELERKAREALGDALDKKAGELTERVRKLGATPGARAQDDEDEGERVASAEFELDPLLAHLSTIEERLCVIEALLLDLSARSTTNAPVAAAPAPAPVATPGATVATGFEKARVRIWINSNEATVKLSVNGIPAGRFDTNTTFDLAPFLQPGRMNQLAFAIEPRRKGDVNGIDLHVDAQMPGTDDYVAILQFKPTKDRLADTLDLPWAPR
jgi:hypothetical protein